MKRYFKGVGDSRTDSLEDAFAYDEFDGEYWVRQINEDAGNWQYFEQPAACRVRSAES
jgi:hypothetical protein